MNTERKNRFIVFSALSCFALLMGLLASLSPSVNHDLFDRPSSYYSDKTGVKGLWMILRQHATSVIQWRKPFAVLDGHQELTSVIDTLIIASPVHPLGPYETQALMRWVEDGGQLILALENDWAISDKHLKGQGQELSLKRRHTFQGQTESQREKQEEDGLLKRLGIQLRVERDDQWQNDTWLTLADNFPAYNISTKETPHWEGDFEALVINEQNEPRGLNIPKGQGRILVIGSDSVISNQAMMQADNAVWWTRMCLSWGKGNVAFDEYHHGFAERRGFASLTIEFMQTPWGWFTLQAMLSGGLFMFINQRRLGRIYETPASSTREALRLLEARSSLLARAKPTRLSAQWIAQTLALDLTRGALKIPWRDWVKLQADQNQKKETGKHWNHFIDQLTKLEQSPSADEGDLIRLGQTAATIKQFYRHEH